MNPRGTAALAVGGHPRLTHLRPQSLQMKSMTSANFIFVMCDVSQMPSLRSAKFFAESKISPKRNLSSVKFRRMPNFAACRVF